MNRISKENYYLNIAQTVLERATCLRRVYGAIIVKNDEIISTGYNGSPRGRKNCVDMGFCTREAMQCQPQRLPQRWAIKTPIISALYLRKRRESAREITVMERRTKGCPKGCLVYFLLELESTGPLKMSQEFL